MRFSLLPFLLSLLIIAAGIVAGGLLQGNWQPTLPQRLRRSAGAVVAGMGVWLAINVLTYDPPGPTLSCHTTIEAARADGLARGVPVFVDFTADWCHNCHVLRDQALNNAAVIARADEFACAMVDVTNEDDPANQAMRQQFGAFSLPTIVFLDLAGNAIPEISIHDIVDAEEFLTHIDAARTGAGMGAKSPFHDAMANWGILATLGLVFLAGIVTSLSPCVYPLIPITISIFGARKAKTKLEGFSLSAVYVGGMVLTYVVLGVVAAQVGGLFGQALQSAPVLIGIGALFGILGLSNAGLFELDLPGPIKERLSSRGKKGYAGAFFMGLVAGLIAAPCVGPWLAGVLLFIFETQDMVLGSAYMTAFALGMGLLFLVLGTFSTLIGRIPRSGAWMDVLKAMFGVIFVVVGLHYLSMVVPALDDLVATVATLGT